MRAILTAMLLAALTLSACGRKGDPIPPGQVEEQDKEKKRGG